MTAILRRTLNKENKIVSSQLPLIDLSVVVTNWTHTKESLIDKLGFIKKG